ncbi:hypothetical protein KQH54_01320 [bacterium]|nr:hypothetical protein [bacterium]
MPTLAQLLADLTSGDEPRAEKAAVQFVSLGNAGFKALAELAKSPNEDFRWWAVRASSEFETPEASTLLTSALQDPAASVQMCAAVALRLHPAETAIPGLIALLGNSDSLLSKVAGDALSTAGSPAAAPLIELIDAPDTPHRVKLEAVRVLASLKETAAISTLFKVFQEGSSMMQYWAEKGLEDLGIGMVFFDPQ